jgi:PPOX class probable F420-dependent enzyme
VLSFPANAFGERAQRRLRDDALGWLTTVRHDGLPQPSPIWFLWQRGAFLIYSQPRTQKLRNIRANPLVSVHLDGDGRGGDIVILSGEAEIDETHEPAHAVPAYVEKYAPGFERLGMTAEQFARSYSVPILVRPTGLRGH